jgi:hypothetical protein
MIATKPLAIPRKIEQPARNPKRMTIGIGMYCDEGLIIAADTRVALSDNTTRKGEKIRQAIADSGIYVAAVATDDANAALMLISDMLTDLQNLDPKNFAALELQVRNSMSEWAANYTTPPWVEVLLGAYIDSPPEIEAKKGGGLRLYNCEAPNVMHPIDRDENGVGYKAIGMPANVTDPLFRQLFSGFPGSVNSSLHRVAYLMYRAKRDAATYCGDETDTFFVKNEFAPPLRVRRFDMEMAESNGGRVDHVISAAMSALYASSSTGGGVIWEAIKQYVVGTGESFRAHKFLTDTGEEVG